MEVQEAADLIDAIADSIKKDPNQFFFEINVTGTRINASGGSTGLNLHVQGGAPGSRTIGWQSNMNGTSVEIARKTANAAVQEQISALAQALNDLASELRNPIPQKSRIEGILTNLKQSWVPGVVTSLIGNLVTRIALNSAIQL